VKVLSVGRDRAVMNVDGAAKTLPLAADPGAGHAVARSSVALKADPRGHFVAHGTVNGRPVTFLVDTGATLTALSRGDAARIGIDYQRGTPGFAMTAGGGVRGWRVSLDSVEIGDVTLRNVDGMVVDNDALSTALLGMSFLGRVDMQQQGSTLILRRTR
jgi:aspartyl protease family protein